MFLANNFYIQQKKFPLKQNLINVLGREDYVYFDAIPTDPNENDRGCSWFATLAWQGPRPDHNYGEKVKEDDPILSTIKTVRNIIFISSCNIAFKALAKILL